VLGCEFEIGSRASAHKSSNFQQIVLGKQEFGCDGEGCGVLEEGFISLGSEMDNVLATCFVALVV
jgi:hypothetical protein